MVQVPTTSGGSSAARASPASAATSSNAASTRAKGAANGHGGGGGGGAAPAPVHLSAMKSAPLDLSSVERRGQPTASRETTKKMRPHGLQEAPTYRPTMEEFKDPFVYMKKIAPEASQYGICKIIPPVDWNPGFAIDTEKFHFKTRKQELNSIEGSTRANLTYLDQLAKFHKQHGTSLTRFPSVDKRPLDLYKLKKAVESRGGFEKVCKLKKWAEIGRDLGYSGKIMSSLSTSLKNSYQRWLFPYEEYLRHAKPGVQAQLEYEYGGPITPSPATSPMKKSHQHTPSSLRDESPAVSASEALNSSLRNGHTNGTDMKEVPMLDPPAQSTPAPAPQPQTSGFTPVNAGGFTAVNAGQGGFTPVNVNNHARREREPERSFTPPRRVVDSPMSSAKNTPEYRPSNLKSTPLTNGFTSNPLKRQMSHDSLDSRKENGTPRDDSDGGANGRRSKRLKKEAVPTVAGSHMSFLRPLTPRIPGEPGSFAPGEKCEHCAKGEDAGTLLVCESCDHGYHMQCLDPPLTQKPDYDWNCPRCLVGDGQFGFEEGSIYSLKQFHDKAADFKEGYFQNRLPFDPVLNCPRPVTEDDIEREFWRLVASLEETVEVEYGADIHSTTHGSGFPTIERNPRDPYSTDPWNLNITPLHPDSLFRHIKSDISGMTVPWLYVGMIFSTFCWHNEDHYAYSANYQHFGSTKTWYGIPGEDAEKFENAMREAVPELFETQPDLLFQLVTLLTPEQLKKAGVRCYALDQRAGQFVITFPQAYHAGFNHGFNFNEAVNFAPKDWEPFGEFGVERLQQFRRQPCFSHDELLWTAAEGHATGGVTIETAKWLAPALERMRGREVELRKNFLAKHNDNGHPCVITDEIEGAGPRCHVKFEVDDRDVPEEEYQCSYCKAYAYLSRYNCDKSGKVLCLLHAGNYECCEMEEEERYKGKNHTLHYRRTEEAISSIYQKVCDKAHLPEVWEDKVTKTLEEDATPSLKVLRALLNEGERIPYELPSLPTLKAFVDRCNEWVDEATNYIVRKQQNRRKSEKSWRKGSKAAEAEERERELRKVENVVKLLKDADGLGFDCPEIIQLRERAEAITSFQRDAKMALDNQNVRDTQVFEELLERGRGLNVDMPETERLEGVVQKNKWNDRAKEARGQFLSLTDIKELIAAAEKLDITPASNSYLRHFNEQKETGEGWEMKAKELMAADSIHYPQLEALSNQAQAAAIPVSAETLAEVDRILNKQREAHRQIVSLYDRSKEADITKRPTYSEVVFTVDSLLDLNSKPSGTLDLEKEQKRHEDWMRKGKKLFGKANAPLHILKSHMEYVLERNLDCFDIMYDKPRMPAEPASREPSPVDGKMHTWEDPRFREVFCICRKVEAGMMIECELCHEWYHGKCLKIARGKVKEDEKYTCPICDWRVKIPRDAARPKLEDLIEWQNEIKSLPFQPDEEDLLARIIDNAQDFRNHVAPFCNPIMATSEESSILRFYLRKIEGAEILLVRETNYFRAQLHTWSPVAPDPPPVLETSKSTRKPRPTKLQKLMAQHGVDDPENLPQALRTKQHGFKRKSSEPQSAPRPAALQPAPGGSGGPGGVPHYAMGGQQQQFSPHQQGGQGNGVYPGGPSPGGGARGGQMLADPQQLHQQQPRFAYDDMPYASRERQGFAPMAFVHAPPYGSGQGSSGSGSGSGTGAPGPFTGAAMGRGGEMTLDGRGLGSPLGEGFEGSLIGGGGGGGLAGGSGGGVGVGGLPGGVGGGREAGREGGMERLFKDLTNADEESGKKEEVGGGEAGELLRDMTMFGEEWGGDE